MVTRRGPFDFEWLDDSSYHAYAGYGPTSDGVPEPLAGGDTLPRTHFFRHTTRRIRKAKS